MAKVKTKGNDGDVTAFLNSVEDEKKKTDSFHLLHLISEITNKQAAMWGGSIVGFDSYHTVYASGREAHWPIVGFSPRKQNLTLYIMPGFDRYGHLLQKLGKHKVGKACLYIKKMEDIDEAVLKELIQESVNYMRQKYHNS
ncbi:MAG: DUF1801 domain-containing protein [Bacteroidota bacterium]